jgi:hypothetical protein
MSQPALTAPLGPEALFVVACPVCRGHVAATGSLCGRDACCPLCASLFHVPVPVPAAMPAETAAEPAAPVEPRDDGPTLAEDWGPVLGQLAPPAGPDASATPEPLPPEPADFEYPEPEAAAAATSVPGSGELVFQEPVRTVRHGNTVIEIRRLTPEERRTRRFRRNLMMIVVGVSLLLLIVLLAGGFG